MDANSSPFVANYLPVWSPDGTMIAYEQQVGNDHYIGVVNADGSGETTIIGALNGGGMVFRPTWSPTKSSGHYKIGNEIVDINTGYGQIYIARDDGGNQLHLTGSDTGDNDAAAPVWSSDGSKIYFWSSHSTAGVYYYTSDTWATAGNVTSHYLGAHDANNGSQKLKISADGSKLTYAYPDGSGCNQIWTASTSTESTTKITDRGCHYQTDSPTFVSATSPNAPTPTKRPRPGLGSSIH